MLEYIAHMPYACLVDASACPVSWWNYTVATGACLHVTTVATDAYYGGHRGTSHCARVAGRCGGRRAAPRVLRGHPRWSGRPSARTDGRHERVRLVTPPRCEGAGAPRGPRRRPPAPQPAYGAISLA